MNEAKRKGGKNMTNEQRDEILLDLKKGQEKLFNGQNQLLERVEKLENGQKETNFELRKLSQTVAKIEVNHGDKLEIILDELTSYPEKFESIQKNLINMKID